MDIFLEENCPNLIEVIKECGYTFEDVSKNPLYCVFGLYGRPELFAEKYGKEIEAAIEFANDYAVDINEFDLSTTKKKVRFALMYIATELESDCQDWYAVNKERKT